MIKIELRFPVLNNHNMILLMTDLINTCFECFGLLSNASVTLSPSLLFGSPGWVALKADSLVWIVLLVLPNEEGYVTGACCC